MKLAYLVFASVALSGALGYSSPHVVGYERFYSDSPSAEGGAILFSELGCANCHGGSPVKVPRQGPGLMDLSRRVDQDWLAKFLRNPGSGREGSTMPDMFHGLTDDDMESVMAYLGSLTSTVKIRAPRHANAERGSALYHEVGCVACHAPTKDFRGPHGSGEDFDSYLAIAHPSLSEKTDIVALTHFLTNPSAYRPDGRMPHVVLEGQEASDLAAHLLDFQGSDPRAAKMIKAWAAPDKSLVKQGRELVRKMNCAACHELPKMEPLKVHLSGTRSGQHCYSAAPGKGMPHYQLTENQRKSLDLFLDGGMRISEDDGFLTLAAMNCVACHSRDGQGGPTTETDPFFIGDEAIADAGRLPPPLSGVGHKLRRDWLESVFAESGESRVRSYLKTRMPIYPDHAALFADWLEELDAQPEALAIEVRDEDLEAGRKLLGVHGGVNCITCHTWGEQSSLGIQALDISELDERLRPTWFRTYLLNPAVYRPGTLMPPLWPGGESSVKDVLGGNAERQIAAIWGFIQKGDGVPEGFPDRTSGAFELKPTDRPIIQRTFLEGAGMKAILVGFPGDIHMAYDGNESRLARVWRGPFFDAYNTWYSRQAPIEKPLSDEVYDVPSSGEEARFRGYRLDGEGNPTFYSTRDGQAIEESYSISDGTLVRRVVWSNGAAPPIFHPEGVSRKETTEGNTLTIIYSWE